MEQEHDRNCFQAVPSSFKRKRGWLLGFTVNYLSLSHHFRFYYARGFHPHFWTSENTYVENIRFILFVPRNKTLQSFYSYKKICFSSDFKGLFNWRVACPIFKQEWMRYSRFLCENRLLALKVSPSKWLARKFWGGRGVQFYTLWHLTPPFKFVHDQYPIFINKINIYFVLFQG